MCEDLKGTLLGYSPFQPLDHSRAVQVQSEHLKESHIVALHFVHVHHICNQFWHYLLCIINWLWQLNEIHWLLLCIVIDLLHWQLKYRTVRTINDSLDN